MSPEGLVASLWRGQQLLGGGCADGGSRDHGLEDTSYSGPCLQLPLPFIILRLVLPLFCSLPLILFLWFSLSPPSSLPSLDLHKLRLTQPQFLCHDVLPHHRPRNNKAKWPWTESSEIILPLMMIFSCIIFTTTECYHIVLYHVSLCIYKIYN